VIVDAACAAPMAALRDLEGLTVWADPGAVPLPPRFRSLPEELAGASEEEPDVAEPGLDDVFLYVYTSGTTGYPKPAVVRHSRFTLAGATLQRIFDVDRDDCIYAPLPLYHGESNFVGFALALRAGACFASRRRFRASEFLADVRRHRATGFVYVGELCRYLLRRPATAGDRDHALRWAAGAGLRPEIWREFQDRFGVRRIYEMYGATEGNVSLLNRTGRVGSVGRPFPFQHDHVKLARLDLSTEELIRGDDGFLVECTAGESGELLGRTDRGRMRYDGYAGDPVASERKLVRSAFAPGDAWFRSGDLLRRDRDGYFHFVDRIGDTFRWRGENVSAQEVADVMQEAPGIGHAAAYGVRIADAEGRGGMSAVALCAASTFDGGRVYEHVARGLPSYAQPLFLRIVDAVETTGTLKPRTVRYRAQGFDPRGITDALYVRDDGARAYVPLTAEAYDAIQSGRRRL
jgi:fatty-acyl-CoA synthase